jgi:hypothetical protein
MKLLIFALAAGIAATPKVAAAADASPLQLRPKAALVAPASPQHNSAPFVDPAMRAAPELDLAPRQDSHLDPSRASCSGERSLCYDLDSGRIVYKPARVLMPEIPGLTRENISIKRDRIILRYSF